MLIFGRDTLRAVSLRMWNNLDLGDLDQGTHCPLSIKFLGQMRPEKMTGEKMNRDGSSWHPSTEFCADLKNVQKSWVWQTGKNFLQKNWIFRVWENLAKNVFMRKNLWELLDARVLHIFEISTKFRFFWYPARPISKKFLLNSYWSILNF